MKMMVVGVGESGSTILYFFAEFGELVTLVCDSW